MIALGALLFLAPIEGVAAEGYVDTHMHLFGVTGLGGRSGPMGPGPMGRGGMGGPMGRPGMGPGGGPASRMAEDWDGAADALVAFMDGNGVAVALVMPPPQNPGQRGAYEFHRIAGALARHPDRLRLVAGGGTLNPMIQGTRAEDVTPALKARFEAKARAAIEAGAAAFGEMTAMHICMSRTHHYVATPADHPLFLLLADLAARHDVPIDLHMEAVAARRPLPRGLKRACLDNPDALPATVPALERLLAHNRKARIVWQHIGWDNVGEMTPALMRRLLAAHPNLYLSIRVEARLRNHAGEPMPNRVVGSDWKPAPEWVALFEDFPDRFMAGGDEFVMAPGSPKRFPESFKETWAAVSALPGDLARRIGRDNAARVYGLE